MARSTEYEEWGSGQGNGADEAGLDVALGQEESEDMRYYEDEESGRAGIFGSGLVIGLAIGSIVALLLAPQSGALTRQQIRRRAGTIGGDVSDRWEDLREELDQAARKSRRRVRRSVDRGRWSAKQGRWRAEDLLDMGRRLVR